MSQKAKILTRSNLPKLLIFLTALLWITASVLLFSQNFAKAIVLIIVCLIWFIAQFVTHYKSVIKVNVLLLLLVFPFNITFQLPISWGLFDPYVNGIYVNYLHPTIFILDVAVLIFVLFALPHVFNAITRKRIICFALLFATYFIHNLYFYDFSVFFNSTRLFLYLFAGICFYLIINEKSSYISIRKSIIDKLLIAVITIQGLIGISQFITGKSHGLQMFGESELLKGGYLVATADIAGDLYLRAYGTFPHPNIFAGFLLVSFIYFMFISKESQIIHIKRYLYGLLISLFILFTMSRVAIIIVLLLWVLEFILIFTKKKFKLKLNSFFITGSIFNIFSERFASLFTHSDISVTHRTYLLDVTKDIIQNNIVFGVGSGKFTYYLANSYSIYVDNVMLLQPVHNIFALFAAEYGMFISFTLAFLYGYLFIHNFVIKNNYMKIVKIIILITIIIIGSFDHYLLTLPQGLALLVFMLTYSLL